jgi:hypothetical protein
MNNPRAERPSPTATPSPLSPAAVRDRAEFVASRAVELLGQGHTDPLAAVRLEALARRAKLYGGGR